MNFAVGLAQDGKRVGLLDADLFGPSIPRMMKLTGEPFVKDNKFVPLANHGVKCMSMGFLVREADAVVWRGLMVMKAVQQLLWQVDWGELDVLVIDLPPGTGDVPLTIAQQVLVDGAIIVTTPQQVALSDVKRGIEMFKKLDIPIYGLVQNMSYFQCSKCSEKHYLFGGLEGCDSLGLKTLGSFPITPAIASEGDAGIPRGIKLDIQLE